MKKQVFIHITNNVITNRQIIKKAIQELKDGRYSFTIESANKRSLPQNAYYHSVIVPMVKEGLREAGWNEIITDGDAHEYLKATFLKKGLVNEKTGEVIESIGSTATLTTIEFIGLIDAVIQWAAEFLNIQIPYPNEQMQLNY